jgi:hypothetical protein
MHNTAGECCLAWKMRSNFDFCLKNFGWVLLVPLLCFRCISAHLLLLSMKLCTIMIVMPMDFQCNFTVAMQTGFVSYWMFHVSCLGFVINH